LTRLRFSGGAGLPGWSAHSGGRSEQVSSNGKSQRNALTAAERAIQALGSGDPDRAVSNADKASSLDQIGIYAEFPAAVRVAATDIEAGGAVDDAGWDAVADAVGPGPLAYLIAEVRDG
jgi:hypothetical protein